MKKIAILGATGYVGRSLLREFFLGHKKQELVVFTRSIDKINEFLKVMPKKVEYSVCLLEQFQQGQYDVIINCTGISSSPDVAKNPFELFQVTEEVDSLVINYLHKHPKALYINISSGVVYGENFEKSVDEKSKTILPAGFFQGGESYAITKINAEAKHRSLFMFNIVDIRVFGFFGSLVDVGSPFLMSAIVKSLQDKKTFMTHKDDIIRDYVIAEDLLSLISLIIKKNKINDYFDIYSKKPISKFELLKALTKKYNLPYTVSKQKGGIKMIAKKMYFSKSKKATTVLGYKPKRTSLEAILFELDKLNLK